MSIAQGIRKGNKVLYSKRNIRITVLKIDQDKIEFESFPENSVISINEVEGVPLTTNILLEIKFQYDAKELKWTNKDISLKNNQDGSFEASIRLNKTKSSFRYLHELQNYYHDYLELYKKEGKALF